MASRISFMINSNETSFMANQYDVYILGTLLPAV